MRATLTVQMPIYDLIAEIDGDYWRNEPDEKVHDLTLCFLWAAGINKEGRPCQVDLLQGLDRPARLVLERNLFRSSPDMVKTLCDDIETMGEDMHLEPEQDPQDY